MPTNGVRLVFTVALLTLAACQSPVHEASTSAHPPATSRDDGQGAALGDAAGPVVNVPAERLDGLSAEPTAEAPSRPRPAASVRPSARQFTYERTPLGDVLDHISQSAGVNMVVDWRSLGDLGITRQTPVSLDLTGVSTAKVLDVLTDDLSGGRDKFGSVYWVVEDGLVRIATGSALNTTLDTRVFNVGDLLMLVPDFEGPRLDLDASDNLYESLGADGDDSPTRAEAEETLIELVKDTIGEDMWRPSGKGSVSIRGEQMIISQTRLGWLLMRRR